jgi:acyl-coenzyme A thioesterase PaaI-like protein
VPTVKAVQDCYPGDWARCYGCGRLNEHGLHLRTSWDGDETVTAYRPAPYHTALPGAVYGGLIASVIDCHSTGTAALALFRAEGREPDTQPPIRCVTASLQVDYLRPTPLGGLLQVRGRIEEVKGRRVTVSSELLADGEVCARGRVVAVRVGEDFGRELAPA